MVQTSSAVREPVSFKALREETVPNRLPVNINNDADAATLYVCYVEGRHYRKG